MVWDIIFACNETTTQYHCIVLFNLPWQDVWISVAKETRRGGNKIEITRKTRRLSPKGFVLVITGCYQTRGIPIYGNLSGLSVIKCNVAYKLHSDICLSMPTHSQRYLCFHQLKHSQNDTFPYQKWYETACNFPPQLRNGI